MGPIGDVFLRIGHRGARAYAVENTLDSFGKAIGLGVNAIEFDVRESKDGRLIICHDDNLKKIFGNDITIKDATLKELKEASGDAVPTLEEALEFIDGKVAKILVELKETGYEEKTLEAVRRRKLADRVIIVSFHEEALSDVRNLDKGIETGLIYARHKDPVEAAVKIDAQYLVSLYRLTHSRNVEDAHKRKLKVIVWTINTKEEVRKYVAKGVDGIATDMPDIFKDII